MGAPESLDCLVLSDSEMNPVACRKIAMNPIEQIQQEPTGSEPDSSLAAQRWNVAREKRKSATETPFLRVGVIVGFALGLLAAVAYLAGWDLLLFPDNLPHVPSRDGVIWACFVLVLTPIGGVMAGIYAGTFAFGLVHFVRPIYFALFRDAAQFDREYPSKEDAIEVELSGQGAARRKHFRFPDIKRELVFGKGYQASFVIALIASLLVSGLLRQDPRPKSVFVQVFVMNPFLFAFGWALFVSLVIFLGRVVYASLRPYPEDSLDTDHQSATAPLERKPLDQGHTKLAEPEIRTED